MIAQARQIPPQPLPKSRAVAIARRRAADLEAALLLGLLLLAGLIWMIVGAAVMRGGAPEPRLQDQGARARPSLQSGLADLEAFGAD